MALGVPYTWLFICLMCTLLGEAYRSIPVRPGKTSICTINHLALSEKSSRASRRPLALLSASDGPEVVSFDGSEAANDENDENDENEGDEEDGDGLSSLVPEDEASGQFKIKKTKPLTILNGELPPPAVFRGKREPAPITDNLVVVGLTILGLTGAVGFFLFLNKVGHFLMITLRAHDNPTDVHAFSSLSNRIFLPLRRLLR